MVCTKYLAAGAQLGLVNHGLGVDISESQSKQAQVKMSISTLQTPILNVTQTAINVFLGSKRDDGLIEGLTYWQTANGYTAIALHDTWSNTTAYYSDLDDLIGRVETNYPDCIDEWNDDSLWWSICSLEMFNLNQEPKYLTMAEATWRHVSPYVIPQGKFVVNGVDMEGGVIWTNKTNETQVNAITTGLYSELSARLACLQSKDTDRVALLFSALNSLYWIFRVRFDDDQYIVLDHIDLATGQCYDWVFTYNTGQALGACIAIFDAIQCQHLNWTKSLSPVVYLDLACNLASHAMTRSDWIDVNGILTEPGAYPGTGPDKKQPYQNDDGIGFKAILLRNLAKLYKVLLRANTRPDMQTQLVDFLKRHYQALQANDTNGKGQYGPWLDGPMDLATSHSQLVALDVMAAIHAAGL